MKANLIQRTTQTFIVGLIGLAVILGGVETAVSGETASTKKSVPADAKTAAAAAAKVGVSTAARTAMGGAVGGVLGGLGTVAAVTLTPTTTACGRGETCR